MAMQTLVGPVQVPYLCMRTYACVPMHALQAGDLPAAHLPDGPLVSWQLNRRWFLKGDGGLGITELAADSRFGTPSSPAPGQ